MPRRIARAVVILLKGYFIAFFFLVIVAIVIAVTTGGDLVRYEAAKRLSALAGAEVTFQDFRILKTGWIEIEGLNINSWPDRSPSCIIQSLRVKPDWREILTSRTKLDVVTADNWILKIEKSRSSREDMEKNLFILPLMEVTDAKLTDGMVVFHGEKKTWKATDVTLGGLVRITSSQSSIRLRKLGMKLEGGFSCFAEAFLWRLGQDAWEFEVGVKCGNGAVVGVAEESDHGWRWDVRGEGIDIASWMSALMGDSLGFGGVANFEGSGTNFDGFGSVLVSAPRWEYLEADALEFDLVLRENALLGESITLRSGGGTLRGAGGVVRERDMWRIWSNVLIDSLDFELPFLDHDRFVVSGEAEASATLGQGGDRFDFKMRGGEGTWKTWLVSGVQAQISIEDGQMRIHELIVSEGTISGSLKGAANRDGFVIDHEVSLSAGHILSPFSQLKADALVVAKGTISSSTVEGLLWSGELSVFDAEGFGLELGAGRYTGDLFLKAGQWSAHGRTQLVHVSHSGDSVIFAGFADISVDKGAIFIEQAVFLAPNGSVLMADGYWDGDAAYLNNLIGVSDRGVAAVLGDSRLEIDSQGVGIRELKIITTSGGWVEARDLHFDPFPSKGRLVIYDLDIGLTADLLGARDDFRGRASVLIKGGPKNLGWARMEGLRRLPATRDFPLDLDVSASWDGSSAKLEQLTLTQEDLKVTGGGVIASTGLLDAWAHCENGSLQRIIFLVDELFGVELRGIFDARRGMVTAHFEASGPIGNPTMGGRFEIEGGAEISVKPIRTIFRDVACKAHLDGHSLFLDEIEGKAGEGKVSLTGRIDLPAFVLEGLSMDIHGKSQEFRILRGLYGIYDADLKLEKLGLGISLDGEVRLLSGLIDLQGLMVEPAPPTQASLDDRWMLYVKIERDVWARDRFLNAEVTGSIAVAKEKGLVSLQGELELLRGTYTYLGRQFNLDNGRVVFLGDPEINPELNITATTTVRSGRPDGEDVVLFLTVTGRVKNPIFSVMAESEHLYTEEQIKTMLLFNLTPEELDLLEGEGFAKEAAATMEDFLAGELARAIRAETGLDELEVSPSLLASEERDLYVRLGKYVTRDIFVSVGKGLRTIGLDEVKVEYILADLAKRLGLGRRADLKLVGERIQEESSVTTYQVQMKLKYRF